MNEEAKISLQSKKQKVKKDPKAVKKPDPFSAFLLKGGS